MKRVILDLLKDCYEDEAAHLELRMIRDAQQPRFEALKESHPEIYRDFMSARNTWHEILLRNRRKRVDILTKIVEGQIGSNKLEIICDSCKKELEKKGGLLFGPPDSNDMAKKTHLCVVCYEKIIGEIVRRD